MQCQKQDASEHMQQEGLILGSFFLLLACMFVTDNAPDQRTYPHQSSQRMNFRDQATG
jgi:hypothetical protein